MCDQLPSKPISPPQALPTPWSAGSDALDGGPLSDNTVVLLWSDHGYHLGHKEHWEKFAHWDQTTHVPLIVAAPGIPGGATCSRPASRLDVFPTLVELCGLHA